MQLYFLYVYFVVIWLKERPFRAASVCLGLLCVLLLTGIIILVNHRE